MEIGTRIRITDPRWPSCDLATVVDPYIEDPVDGLPYGSLAMYNEFIVIPDDPSFDEGCLYYLPGDEGILWELA